MIKIGLILFQRGRRKEIEKEIRKERTRRRNTCIKSTIISNSLWQRVKGIKKRDTVQKNACEKITENLDVAENSNFIRGSTEAAVRGYSVVESYYSKVKRLKPVPLLPKGLCHRLHFWTAASYST